MNLLGEDLSKGTPKEQFPGFGRRGGNSQVTAPAGDDPLERSCCKRDTDGEILLKRQESNLSGERTEDRGAEADPLSFTVQGIRLNYNYFLGGDLPQGNCKKVPTVCFLVQEAAGNTITEVVKKDG